MENKEPVVLTKVVPQDDNVVAEGNSSTENGQKKYYKVKWKKREKTNGSSSHHPFSENDLIHIAVTPKDFPVVQMEEAKLKKVHRSILEMYEQIPDDGPQVRLLKCKHEPGYLVVTCVDDSSAEWLRRIVPSLKPWEGATLMTLEGDEIPQYRGYRVYIPDEEGASLDVNRILSRLRVGNRGLKTNLWLVGKSSKSNKGSFMEFYIDHESKVELDKLGRRPFFGMGRVKFEACHWNAFKSNKNNEHQ